MTIKVAASVALMVAAAMTHSLQSIAQNYPAKPVRVVVPLAPGGATDIQARVFSQKLSQSLGQTFIVDNRAGAGGLIAFNFVQQAAPDGYTLLATTPTLTIMPALYEKPSFDAMKDFEPVILMSKAPFALISNPSFPANSLKEFLAWAKANPGKLNFAIPGVGTINHLATIWMEEAGDIKTAMIPYKGAGPANQDLIAGQVHATFANVTL